MAQDVTKNQEGSAASPTAERLVEFKWRGKTYYSDGQERVLEGREYFRVFDNRALTKNDNWPKTVFKESCRSGGIFTKIMDSKVGRLTKNRDEAMCPPAFSKAKDCNFSDATRFKDASGYFNLDGKSVNECHQFGMFFSDQSSLIFQDFLIGYSPFIAAPAYCVNTFTGERYEGKINNCRR